MGATCTGEHGVGQVALTPSPSPSPSNLDNDEDLVHFFSAVLERRSKIETLEENEREAPTPGSGQSITADVCQPQFSVAGQSSYVYRED